MSNNDDLTFKKPALIDMAGARFEAVASMGDDDADIVLFRSPMEGGSSVPLHSHIDPECLYVLSGSIEAFVIGGASGWHMIKAGHSILFADGVKHALRNDMDQPADLILATNNRLARFFSEAGRPVQPGTDKSPPTPGDIERIVRASDKYGYWMSSPEESEAITG